MSENAESLGESQEIVDKLIDVSTSHEEVMRIYNEWVAHYEDDTTETDYNGPAAAADDVMHVLGDRKNARIIDLAAGTGIVGKLLKDQGFTNMDGLDGSAEMLKLAEANNIYTNYFVSFVGNGIKLPMNDETYDLAVSVGAFIPNHFPVDWIDDVFRIVKPGGYIVAVLWDRHREFYEGYALDFISDGRMTIVEKRLHPNIYQDTTATTFVFQKRE